MLLTCLRLLAAASSSAQPGSCICFRFASVPPFAIAFASLCFVLLSLLLHLPLLHNCFCLCVCLKDVFQFRRFPGRGFLPSISSCVQKSCPTSVQRLTCASTDWLHALTFSSNSYVLSRVGQISRGVVVPSGWGGMHPPCMHGKKNNFRAGRAGPARPSLLVLVSSEPARPARSQELLVLVSIIIYIFFRACMPRAGQAECSSVLLQCATKESL